MPLASNLTGPTKLFVLALCINNDFVEQTSSLTHIGKTRGGSPINKQKALLHLSTDGHSSGNSLAAVYRKRKLPQRHSPHLS
jgi:hypothetical protein